MNIEKWYVAEGMQGIVAQESANKIQNTASKTNRPKQVKIYSSKCWLRNHLSNFDNELYFPLNDIQ